MDRVFVLKRSIGFASNWLIQRFPNEIEIGKSRNRDFSYRGERKRPIGEMVSGNFFVEAIFSRRSMKVVFPSDGELINNPASTGLTAKSDFGFIPGKKMFSFWEISLY